MTRLEDTIETRNRMDTLDLNRAKSLGFYPPEMGTNGTYHSSELGDVSFYVVGVKGMICYCRYMYQDPDEEPSSFIWVFGVLRGKPEYNKNHDWVGKCTS